MKCYLRSILRIMIIILISILFYSCDNDGTIPSTDLPQNRKKVKITYEYEIKLDAQTLQGVRDLASEDMDSSTTQFETPVHPEGRVISLKIGEMPIELKNKEIENGILSTKEYSGFEVFLTGYKQGRPIFELHATKPQIEYLKKDIVKYLSDKQDLFSAVLDDDIPKLKALIDANANLNVRSVDDITPLIAATIMDRPKIVRLLIDADADVDARDHIEWTALIHFASAGGNMEIARVLINARADINARGQHGTTALIMAAVKGNMDLAKMLVEAGADLDIAAETTEEHFTALYAAESNGHKELAEYLKKSGAE